MKSKDWFKPRHYLHFDNRLGSVSRAKIQKIVSDPSAIARHSFLPFLRYEKEKPKFKFNEETQKRVFEMGIRPICYASHLDAHIYAYYSQMLNSIYEQRLVDSGLAENVIAFRKITCKKTGKPKSNIHFASEAFDAISRFGECQVFAFDIKSFFDTLDAGELKKQWAGLLGQKGLPEDHYKVFKSVTQYSVVQRDKVLSHFGISRDLKKQKHLRRICSPEQFRERVRQNNLIEVHTLGIPQGSPISATLANIYMLGFDLAVSDSIKKTGGEYYRYCDDILIILPLNENLKAGELIKDELSRIKLKLNDSKTEHSFFYRKEATLVCDRPIQYLGFRFDGKSKSLRPSSISCFKADARRAVSRAIIQTARFNESQENLGKKKRPVYVKKILRKYSHLGERTFISYGRRAQEIMESDAIRLQLADLHRFIENQIKGARSLS